MTNQEQAADEVVVEEAAAETTEEATEETTAKAEESSSTSQPETEIDYDAIRSAEEARKPDPKKAGEAFKERQQKREERGADEDDEDRPVTMRDLKEMLSSTKQETTKVLTETEALRIARSLSSKDAEAQAILAKWRNRTFPEGMPLQEQLEEMHAVVNRKRLLSVTREATRALENRDRVSQDPAGTHRDATPGSAPKIAADLKSSLARAGFVYSEQSRRWEKKLPNGKQLVKDTPTAKPRLV